MQDRDPMGENHEKGTQGGRQEPMIRPKNIHDFEDAIEVHLPPTTKGPWEIYFDDDWQCWFYQGMCHYVHWEHPVDDNIYKRSSRPTAGPLRGSRMGETLSSGSCAREYALALASKCMAA